MGYFERTENFREYIKTAHFSRVEAYNSPIWNALLSANSPKMFAL